MSLEQWKGVTDTWFAALFKYAAALLMLHYSGLAVPLLALFGYTPSSGKAEAAAQPVVASAVMTPAAISSSGSHAVDEEASRRLISQSSSSTTETLTRRHRAWKPTHKSKPAAPAPAPAVAAAPAPVAAPVVMTPVAQSPLLAAMPEGDDAESEAFLRINSRPWSQVFVDGTHVGHTPKLDLRVRAGAHRIRLVNPELGVSKTVDVRAAAGETVSHVEFMEQ